MTTTTLEIRNGSRKGTVKKVTDGYGDIVFRARVVQMVCLGGQVFNDRLIVIKDFKSETFAKDQPATYVKFP